ncbi:MAG: restriction endonuclease [Oscillospiraceae bacterium]|nr:restriction endonuclease [Oscillospiraceae bacterium]
MQKFYEFFNPVLEVMKDEKTYSRADVSDKVADMLKLTHEQRSVKIKSGKHTYIDRTQWAMTYLKQAGALSIESRNQWKITKRGLDLLKSEKTITPKTLKQFPEFLEFTQRTGMRKTDAQTDVSIDSLTPEEMIDEALAKLDGKVLQELKDLLASVDPYHFEKICKDLLVAMGYGGSSEELNLSYVTKKSGDGGIDAIIKQDPLGINTIYVQAKRYQGEVREKDIRDFLGALAQKATQNGVFITTGRFSVDALRAIEIANNMNIIPIDGNQLVKLMAQHGVGVEEQKIYKTQKVDIQYFEE